MGRSVGVWVGGCIFPWISGWIVGRLTCVPWLFRGQAGVEVVAPLYYLQKYRYVVVMYIPIALHSYVCCCNLPRLRLTTAAPSCPRPKKRRGG